MKLIRKIGTMVRDARKRANMTQGELGDVIGISAPALCELETGNRKTTPSPEEMARISAAVRDDQLLQDYCSLCPVRKRLIVRKFKPLNNILQGAHVSTFKVSQKLAEASEALTQMMPQMLRKGFEHDLDFREVRNEAVLKILDVERGADILLEQMIVHGWISSSELRLLMDMQQRQCEEKGHHVPVADELEG